jgi:hypothetical protein
LEDAGGASEGEIVASVAIRLILPLKSGYVTRADFLQRRLECCEQVVCTISLVQPTSFVEAVPCQPERLSWASLGAIASRAVGAINLRVPIASHDDGGFDHQLWNRLSFPWLVPDPIPLRRIAWVQGRDDIESIGRAFDAAASLGIQLVIFDEPGHWLQSPQSPSSQLREAFIELDITPDAGLGQRIAAAVRSYPKPIDGIMTISDVRLAAVAWASNELGLATESPDAYNIAADKGRTRMLEEEESMGLGEKLEGSRQVRQESFILNSATDLELLLEDRRRQLCDEGGGGPLLEFPRVVKPVVGWSSECVTRVESVPELVAAVKRASNRHAASPIPSTAVVVEPYVDGPEVDANLVVLNGEVLFCDISDDFPSSADSPSAGYLGMLANFEETQNVMPSALPAGERNAVQKWLLSSIIRQGFNSGIFHCEARIRNSRFGYRLSPENGVVDLIAKGKESGIPNKDSIAPPETDEFEVYLHEINARPPGYLESVAVLLAYGVDYYALRLLMAIGPAETARLRALSQPFLDGPQFHLSVLMVHQAQAGVMKSQDAVGEFLDKYPEVKANVVDYYSRKKGGDALEGLGSNSLCWVGFLSIVSRQSRADLLQRVKYVASHLTYQMETPEGRVVCARGLTSENF